MNLKWPFISLGLTAMGETQYSKETWQNFAAICQHTLTQAMKAIICFHLSPICRYDSFSNSEISLEQKSLEDAAKDVIPSPLFADSSSLSMSQPSPSPSLFLHPPFSAPCTSLAFPASSSSPRLQCATSVFQFDKPPLSASFETTGGTLTPPPLPPKLCLPSEQQSVEGTCRLRPLSAQHFSSHNAFFPRRTSLSGLDHFRIGMQSLRWHVIYGDQIATRRNSYYIYYTVYNFVILGDAESQIIRNRRQSLNLVREMRV